MKERASGLGGKHMVFAKKQSFFGRRVFQSKNHPNCFDTVVLTRSH